MSEPTTRCTYCWTEFTDEELEGATGCPQCGTTGVPCAVAQDTNIAINWHELRCLTIWANNWALQECGPDTVDTVNAIIGRLDAQRPKDWPALTIAGEVRALRDSGYTVELRDANGERVPVEDDEVQ